MDSLVNYIQDINASTAGATSVVDSIQSWIWENFLFVALIVVGLFLTIRTRAVQWRSLPEMLRVLTDPSGHEADGRKSISSFRAFTVSAASRVGTGNIAGVAIAIAMGGPGAVFWMWVIAAVGGASAFAESLLGQLYKERGKDSYIGGPAYYMQRGLNARWLGLIFVGFIVLTYSFMVPFMAVLYMLLGLFVVVLNVGEIPNVLLMIFQGAFGLREFVVGGTMGAVIWGMKRGLLSNEAGMGTAPNAGATATISHPAKQGYVQALGVYFDTMLVCSVTAFIVLLSNPTYGNKTRGAGLTQDALAHQLGTWATHFLTIAIFLFAFSSVIGNYYYGESNIRFVTEKPGALTAFRLVVLGFVFFGAIASLELVWTTADMLNAGMVIVNLIAVVWLSPKVVAVLKNYERQRKSGVEPIFKASDMPEIKNLAAWDGTDEVTTREFWAERDAAAAAKRAKKAANV